MKVTSAEFIKSAFARKDFPRDLRREIAFLGRSNVGKSSLINSLLQRKKLAKTSNTPGRTQCINFFLVNESFYFVDLPGYGYARVSKAMREEWRILAEEYLAERKELVLSIQLVDSRHLPTELDLQLFNWLRHREIPTVIVPTKADKLSVTQLKNRHREFATSFPSANLINYSSVTGMGRETLWSEIASALRG